MIVRRRWRCALLLALAAMCAACGSSSQNTATEPPAAEPTAADEATASEAKASGQDNISPAIIQAVADPARTAEDRARDSGRQPAEIMAFFGLEPGMKVAELMAGGGYYAELFARVVGPEGKVYTHNTPFVIQRFADKPLSERLDRLQMPQIERIDAELTDLGLPAGELDVVTMILFYHDTYWMGIDRAAMNQQIFDALKPGGVYGIIDHIAAPGRGVEDVKTIHRIDPEELKRDITAAGFVLDGESDLLRHPEDDGSQNVFDAGLRGQTDRAVLRFRKPRDAP
ncbi:MAG: class I SAM-dependent methyltransferase [Haliangiales bacterium]